MGNCISINNPTTVSPANAYEMHASQEATAGGSTQRVRQSFVDPRLPTPRSASASKRAKASSRSPRLTVSVAQHLTATGNEALHTFGLGDCSAVVFMTNRDPATGIYRDRTMLHVNGSDIGQQSQGANGTGYTTAQRVLADALNRRSGSDHRLVIGFGANSSSDYAQELFEGQLSRYTQVCGSNVERRSNCNVLTVAADGRIL
jgi:hypothetical protein